MKTLTLKQTPQGLVKVKKQPQKAIAKAYPAHCCMNCKFGKCIRGEEVECPKCIGGYTYLSYVCRLFRFRY